MQRSRAVFRNLNPFFRLAEEEGMELLWEKRFPQAAEEYLKNERWRSNLYRKLKEFNHRTVCVSLFN